MSHTLRPAFAVAVLSLTACEGRNPVEPIATPTTPATVAAQPTPQPAPTPSEPAPPMPTNHPPTVTLTGGGSCHPGVGRPCSVEFQAEVRDRDGDRVRLEWQGCTSGTGVTELCTIDRPGDVTAIVVATDSQGATTRATGTARGTNLSPVVRIGPHRPPDPAPANTFYSIVGDEPYDPDDWTPYMNLACPHARVSATGPCRASLGLCGGAGDAFDVDLTTLAGPGTCVVEATVTDPWGAVGRDSFSFRVLAP